MNKEKFKQWYANAEYPIEENLATNSNANHTNSQVNTETIIKREASSKTVDH